MKLVGLPVCSGNSVLLVNGNVGVPLSTGLTLCTIWPRTFCVGWLAKRPAIVALSLPVACNVPRRVESTSVLGANRHVAFNRIVDVLRRNVVITLCMLLTLLVVTIGIPIVLIIRGNSVNALIRSSKVLSRNTL